MLTPSNEARIYVQATDSSFWRWDGADVIVWEHGKTIIFRQELLGILQAVSAMGAPPLGALLLLISATRDNWREWDTEFLTLEQMLDSLPDSEHARVVLERVLEGLDRVHALPADCRSSMASRIVLVEMVFEQEETELSSRETLGEIVRILEDAEHVVKYAEPMWDFGSATLLRDLMCLSRGLGRVDAEAIRNRMQTGMDSLPIASDEQCVGDRVRALLSEMEQDEQWRALSGVAQKLLAAITLPRQISHPDDLPVGGVSDISNRGSLDKLLLSELANDDLTLSVRVAMNEALYLRRETAKRSYPKRRAILLDTGISCWGLPRVFSTAVGLALAAAGDDTDNAQVFSTCGASVADVDLTTREGLAKHLSSLELATTPADAWPLFCERASGDDVAEPVLVTTEEVMADPEFQTAIRENDLQEFLVATVSRDGQFHLCHRSMRGAKSLRHVQLDLASLLETPRHASALRSSDWLEGLPEIFRHQIFPLRLSEDAGNSWLVPGHGMFAVTGDQRLVQWPEFAGGPLEHSPSFGARQICDTLGVRHLLWASGMVDERQCTHAIVGQEKPHFLEIDLSETMACRVQQLPGLGGPFRSAVIHNGALLVISNWQVTTFDPETMRSIHRRSIQGGPYWVRDRFFMQNGEWFALGFDGAMAQFTLVHRDARRYGRIVAMFHREGVEGPVAVTDRGIFLSGVFSEDLSKGDDVFATAASPHPETSSEMTAPGSDAATNDPADTIDFAKLRITNLLDVVRRPSDESMDPPISVPSISRDGHRIVLQGTGKSGLRRVRVDLRDQRCHASTEIPGWTLSPERTPATRSVRTRFSHVGVSTSGSLVLRARSGKLLAVVLQATVMCFRETHHSPILHPFEQFQHRSPARLRLRVAKVSDDATVYLDGRGMIHCVSSAPGVSDFSLILHDRRLAGWAPGERIWGDPFFTANASTISDHDAYRTLILPFVNSLL